MKESNLIYRCQQHERAAQRLLFDQYYNYVYTICHRYLQHHHDAEDVVSIIFNRIFKNINKMTDTADMGLKRWIQTIAINESIRFLKKRQPIDYTDDDKLLEGNLEIADSPVEIDMGLIKKVVNEMPTGYRTIFLMNVVEGLSHTEIAEYLGISRNTSKSQMLKARKYKFFVPMGARLGLLKNRPYIELRPGLGLKKDKQYYFALNWNIMTQYNGVSKKTEFDSFIGLTVGSIGAGFGTEVAFKVNSNISDNEQIYSRAGINYRTRSGFQIGAEYYQRHASSPGEPKGLLFGFNVGFGF